MSVRMSEDRWRGAFVLYGYICAKKLWISVDEGLGVVNAGTALIHLFFDTCRRHNIHGRVDYCHCDGLGGIPPLILCVYLSL